MNNVRMLNFRNFQEVFGKKKKEKRKKERYDMHSNVSKTLIQNKQA